MMLTYIQIADFKALLFRQILKQRAKVGVGQAQGVTTQLQYLFSC